MKKAQYFAITVAVSALVVCTVLFAQPDSSNVKKTNNINSYSDYLVIESNSIPGLVSKLNKLKDYKLAGGVVVSVERTMNNIEFKTYYQTVYK